MIGVTMIATNTYEAVVDRDGKSSRHRVTLSPQCYRALSGGAFTHEWVIVQVLRFLREREPTQPSPSNSMSLKSAHAMPTSRPTSRTASAASPASCSSA